MMRYKKHIGIAFLVLTVITAGFIYSIFYKIGKIPSEKEYEEYVKYPYYSVEKGTFVQSRPPMFYPERVTGGEMSFSRFIFRSENAPEKPMPQIKLKKEDFSVIPDDFAIYWLGHSSAIIEIEQKRVLIDPVFSNAFPVKGIVSRFQESPIKRSELPDIDMVIITHDHYDHLEYETIAKIKNRNIIFVVPLGVGARLRGWDVDPTKIIELGWDETASLSGIEVTACESLHQSRRGRKDRNKTLWASFAIKSSNHNIFWSGDSGYADHFKNIGDKYGPFDIACVEIDGWNPGWPDNHLFPEQVIQVCKDVNSSLLLPIHWAVFDLAMHRWDESINEVTRIAAENSINVATPIMGEKYIPNTTATKEWWKE